MRRVAEKCRGRVVAEVRLWRLCWTEEWERKCSIKSDVEVTSKAMKDAGTPFAHMHVLNGTVRPPGLAV